LVCKALSCFSTRPLANVSCGAGFERFFMPRYGKTND
jgi:hypothetical protein